MKDTLYWTALLVGLAVFMIIFFWTSPSLEGFATEDTPAQIIPNDYNEILNPSSNFINRFPFYSTSKVFAYISAFSKVMTRDSEEIQAYSVETMRWRDLVNRNDFNMQTSTALPPSLTTSTEVRGLSLLDVKLENVSSSEQFGKDPANGVYDLDTFSVAFFMKWNAMPTEVSVMTLMEMFAETPNYVAWRFTNTTATSVTMEVILGDVNTSYTWRIPTSTVLSNGNNTLYSLVYNTATKTISVFIGTNEFKQVLTDVPKVKLSNSKLAINSNKNINANLKAFVFFKDAVLTTTELTLLTDYFVKESGGNTAMLGQTEQKLKAAEQENDKMRDELDKIQNMLSTCAAPQQSSATQPPANPLAGKNEKWQIKTDFPNGTVPLDDLKKCSPLEVKKFGEATKESPLMKQLPKDLVESKPPFSDYDVANPTKRPPPPPPTPSKEQAPEPPKPTTKGSGSDFYNALVNEVIKQNNITEETAKKVDDVKVPVNDDKAVPAVEQVSFFEFIKRYMV